MRVQSANHSPNPVQLKFQELYSQGKLIPGELDEPCIADLDTLSYEQACQALDFLVNVSKISINNKSAFLKGIIAKSRAKEAQARQRQALSPSGFFALHPIVQAKLTTLFNIGIATREEFDPSIFESLAQFDPLVGCQIVDIFAQKDMGKLNSKSGFLAGIMKRFRETAPSYYPAYQAPQFGTPDVTYSPYEYGGPPPPPSYPSLHTAPPLPTLHQKQLPPPVLDSLHRLTAAGLLHLGELDGAILDSLAQFPAEIGLAILDKFAQADLPTIQNKNGFLAGIMKRFRGGSRAGNVEDNIQAQALLPPSVQAALMGVYATGLVGRAELDIKVYHMLGELSEFEALDVVIRFQNSRLSHISNRSGFLVGIINKVKQNRPGPPIAPDDGANLGRRQ